MKTPADFPGDQTLLISDFPFLRLPRLHKGLLYGIAVVGFLVGSWFLGRAITVMTKGQNPLVWKGLTKKDEN